MSKENIRRRSSAAGFTLIELLLVLVILAVLAAVVVPKFAGRGEQARNAAARTDIANLDNAIDQFEVDAGRYPTSEEGLNALLNQPGNVKTWNGPYVKRAPIDPWGHPYNFRSPGQHNTKGVDIYSFGPDGQDGGTDDVTNWQE